MMTAHLAAMGWHMGVLALTASERWTAARQLNSGFTGLTWPSVAGAIALLALIVSGLMLGCRRGPRRTRSHW